MIVAVMFLPKTYSLLFNSNPVCVFKLLNTFDLELLHVR